MSAHAESRWARWARRFGPRAAEARLGEAFGHAAPEHFAWQTRHPVVGAAERKLVEAAFLPLGRRVLDLGCAEGATLWHLGAPEGAVGVDLFDDKLELARKLLPACRFVRASAYELPFPDGAFDHVLVRDVVHHVEDTPRFFDECARVLEAGGRLDVLEPCRYNPMILAHALANPAERGELRSSASFLVREISRRFRVAAVDRHQALPLSRVIFHPELGWPKLADRANVASAVALAERLAESVVPRFARAYVHLRALKPDGA